ncbi:hypothetical protein ABZ622_35765 [Streptomyces sp. NPDC007164]|uniref:hypothetical protein n=1 Tax=Streptomyces sp. NPDC007164 TaxID=3156918 RepID=UPI0033F42B26
MITARSAARLCSPDGAGRSGEAGGGILPEAVEVCRLLEENVDCDGLETDPDVVTMLQDLALRAEQTGSDEPDDLGSK